MIQRNAFISCEQWWSIFLSCPFSLFSFSRFTRSSNSFDQRYYLRISDVGPDDEALYCCELSIQNQTSHHDCTHLRYKCEYYHSFLASPFFIFVCSESFIVPYLWICEFVILTDFMTVNLCTIKAGVSVWNFISLSTSCSTVVKSGCFSAIWFTTCKRITLTLSYIRFFQWTMTGLTLITPTYFTA